jgi:hypothetical protein
MSYRMDGELTLKGLPPVRLAGIMASTEQNAGDWRGAVRE